MSRRCSSCPVEDNFSIERGWGCAGSDCWCGLGALRCLLGIRDPGLAWKSSHRVFPLLDIGFSRALLALKKDRVFWQGICWPGGTVQPGRSL